MILRWSVLALLVPALDAQDRADAAASQPSRTVRTGEHYEIVCHFGGAHAARLADEALAIAEAVWKGADQLYGVEAEAPESPLRLHLYPDAASYEAAEASLTGGEFRRNLAFAHFETVTAHVALQPPCAPETFARIGLPPQTQRLVSHEAAHLARYHRFPNHRIHPGWLSDGAATWLDHEVLRRVGDRSTWFDEPYVSQSVVRVQRLGVAGRLPAVRDLLHDRVDVEFSDRYAVRGMFFRFLRERNQGKLLGRLMRAVFAMGESADAPAKLRATFDDVLGRSGYRKLDRAFGQFITGLRPGWEEVYRSMGSLGSGWVQTAFPGSNAICWRTAPVDVASYRIEGRLTLLPAPPDQEYAPQLNVLLGRSELGFVVVALRAGAVVVFDYKSLGNDWDVVREIACPGLRVGEEIGFEVAVDAGRVAVSLDGQCAVEADLGKRDMTGPWGLGCQAGRAGIWHAVSVDKGKAGK